MNIWNKSKILLPPDYKDKIRFLQSTIPLLINNCQSHIDFSIIFVTKQRMRKINACYRNINMTTDVLAFRDRYELTVSKVEQAYIGDIYICLEIANEQKHVKNLNEVFFLIIHGLLHLLGFDHQKTLDEKKMLYYQMKIIDYYQLNYLNK